MIAEEPKLCAVVMESVGFGRSALYKRTGNLAILGAPSRMNKIASVMDGRIDYGRECCPMTNL